MTGPPKMYIQLMMPQSVQRLGEIMLALQLRPTDKVPVSLRVSGSPGVADASSEALACSTAGLSLDGAWKLCVTPTTVLDWVTAFLALLCAPSRSVCSIHETVAPCTDTYFSALRERLASSCVDRSLVPLP